TTCLPGSPQLPDEAGRQATRMNCVLATRSGASICVEIWLWVSVSMFSVVPLWQVSPTAKFVSWQRKSWGPGGVLIVCCQRQKILWLPAAPDPPAPGVTYITERLAVEFGPQSTVWSAIDPTSSRWIRSWRSVPTRWVKWAGPATTRPDAATGLARGWRLVGPPPLFHATE